MKKTKAERLTPERVIEILSTEKSNISREQAIATIKFIDTLAKIAVNQYLRNK